MARKVYILGAPAVLGLCNDQRGHITFSTAIYGLGLWAPYPARAFSSRAVRMASKGLARGRRGVEHRGVVEDRTGPTSADRRRLTVPQAAEALGVTVDAVRGRIRRRKLEAERDDTGTVYVWVEASPEDRRGPSATSQRLSDDQAGRIEDLREEVAYLREQLQQANDRDRENRRIIAALTSRIPAIEAPSDERESPQTAREEPERAEPPPATGEAQEPAWRRWRRRVIGR
jgi:hypothetical protein